MRLVLELEDGREIRFRDIRKFGKVGVYGRDEVTGELLSEPGGAAVFASIGPEPLDDAFTVRAFREAPETPQGTPQAAAPRPVVRRRRRQHLRRRGALGRAPAPAPHRRARSGRPTSVVSTPRSAGSLPRRSRGAARRSTTTRRPTATGRCRSTCTSTSGPAAVPALRASHPTDRRRRPGDPLLLVVPAALRRRSGRRASHSSLDGRRRNGVGRRWTELGGEGSLGLTRGRAERRKAAATRRAAARASAGG